MLRPIVLMVCLFAAPALAHSEEPAPASVTAPAPGLAGVWFLNAKASDDVEPLLAALGRSSMERAMAKWVTHAVTLGDGWIEVENANFPDLIDCSCLPPIKPDIRTI